MREKEQETPEASRQLPASRHRAGHIEQKLEALRQNVGKEKHIKIRAKAEHS